MKAKRTLSVPEAAGIFAEKIQRALPFQFASKNVTFCLDYKPGSRSESGVESPPPPGNQHFTLIENHVRALVWKQFSHLAPKRLGG